MGRARNRKKLLTRQERIAKRARTHPPTLLQQQDAIKLTIIAHHEAGHTVAALAMGFEAKNAWVDLRGRGNLYGYHELVAPPWAQQPVRPVDVDPEQAAYFYRRLVVACAGLEAEDSLRAQLRERHGVVMAPDTKSDQDQMVPAALLVGRGEPEAAKEAYDAAMACAEQVLAAHWTVVERLAAALAQAGDMDGPQIMQVVAAAGGVHAQPPALPAPLVERAAAAHV